MKPLTVESFSHPKNLSGPIVDLRAELEGRLEKAKGSLADAHVLEREMIQFQISTLESDLIRVDTQARAQGTLIFDGGPVLAGVGIETDFASKALEHFQNAVGLRSAKLAKGSKAAIPPALVITGTVSGSFGFIIEEMTNKDGLQLASSPLMQAMEEVQGTLAKATTGDRDSFIASLQGLGGANEPLGQLLTLCKVNHASLRINTPRLAVGLTYDRVAEGAVWYQEASSEARPVSLHGTLTGLFTLGRKFEFLPLGMKTEIKGALSEALDPHSLAKFVDQEVEATFIRLVTKKRSKNRSGNPTWVLKEATPLPQPNKLIP